MTGNTHKMGEGKEFDNARTAGSSTAISRGPVHAHELYLQFRLKFAQDPFNLMGAGFASGITDCSAELDLAGGDE